MRLYVLFCMPLLTLSSPDILKFLRESEDHMATENGGNLAVQFCGSKSSITLNRFHTERYPAIPLGLEKRSEIEMYSSM